MMLIQPLNNEFVGSAKVPTLPIHLGDSPLYQKQNYFYTIA